MGKRRNIITGNQALPLSVNACLDLTDRDVAHALNSSLQLTETKLSERRNYLQGNTSFHQARLQQRYSAYLPYSSHFYEYYLNTSKSFPSMDRSLDDVISEKRGNGDRGRQRQNRAAGDGTRKSHYRYEPRNLDRDWVHDKYDDDEPRLPSRNPRGSAYARLSPDADLPASTGAKLRVDNLHYDLTEDDLRGLFSGIGRVLSVNILYDKQDRSQGIAFVTYASAEDARTAIREFDNANAHGQPIRLTLMSSGPGGRSGPARNPFDSVVKPGRSLFDRISASNTSSEETNRRYRSASPARHSDVSRPAPNHIDRYVPGRRTRSPMPRQGRGRVEGVGRRSGSRREDTSRKDGERVRSQPRPRKTAEQLDAEMEDYWGAPGGDGSKSNTVQEPAPTGTNAVAAHADDDIDMIQ